MENFSLKFPQDGLWLSGGSNFKSWYNSIKRWEDDKNMKRELLIRDKVRNQSLEELKFFKPKINKTSKIYANTHNTHNTNNNKSNKEIKKMNNEITFRPIINKNYKFVKKNEKDIKLIEEKFKKFQLFLEGRSK